MHIADVTTKGPVWTKMSVLIQETVPTFSWDTSKKYYFQVKSDAPVTFNHNTNYPTGKEGIVLNYNEMVMFDMSSGEVFVYSHTKPAIINVYEEQ